MGIRVLEKEIRKKGINLGFAQTDVKQKVRNHLQVMENENGVLKGRKQEIEI